MIPDNLKSITNEELLALSKTVTGREYDRVWDEIRKRAKEAKQHSVAEEEERPFDSKRDVSADARYLWTRIFIWFWLVPFVSALLYWMIRNLR